MNLNQQMFNYMKPTNWLFAILLIISSCNSETKKPDPKSVAHASKKISQLNVSILLDLSDRIDTTKYLATPQYYQRDIADINAIARTFKSKIETKKIFDLKDKLKVYFHPMPTDAAIVNVASKLNIDLAGKEKGEIAKIYDNVENTFAENSNKLYQLVIKNSGSPGKFPGSNIWRFMKDEVPTKCIDKDSTFRNILVIITDGYMYYSSDQKREKNRYNYIERDYEHLKKFRQSNALSNFDNDDYGFIPAQNNLSNLEVLILEIAPPDRHPEDYDILKKYWEKWLTEMKVKKFQIIKTDLPINTESTIKNFF